MAHTILEMAKDFVLAQMQVQALSLDNVRHVLQHTHRSLLTLQAQEAGKGTATPPARVHWRTSITKHTVTCLECGVRFKQLSGRHFRLHALNAASYRAKYGIPRTQPLAAKATTALRKQRVQQSHPWENAPTYQKAHPVQAQTTPSSGRKGKSRTTRAVA